MRSAAARKSLSDLSRRRARTLFTVATLALAVASIAFLAVPTLIDRAMQEEVRAARLADVTVSLRPMPLSARQLDALAALPNVAAVEPRSGVDTRVLVGERRVRARVFGVRDFARQRVDAVRIVSGAAPGPGEVLSDVQNANVGRYDGAAGDTLRLVGAPGAAGALPGGPGALRVSGRGRDIPGGEEVQDEDLIALYATPATVVALGGDPGYGRLAFLLHDPSPAAAERTLAAIRGHLLSLPGFTGFRDLQEVRAPGDWPGRDETGQFTDFMAVITVLALLAALVLVANTMTTLVAEQTGEIGVMRAIGARRRQVALVYARTALLLGALGAAVGAALGVLVAWAIARYFGSMFWAADVADRLLRHAGALPRTAQIGLRNMARRARRSLATALVVALAVGSLLAVLGLATAVTDVTRSNWDDHLEDVRVWTSGRALFDDRAERVIRTTPGVAEVQPALVNEVALDGDEAFVWAMPREPLFRHRVSEGRWFTAAEERARERVAVIEANLALATGVEVGDRVALTTAAGPARVRVVGVADNQQENGTVLFMPLTTARELLGAPAGASTYWIRTDAPDHALVDRTTALLEDRLAAIGHQVATEITYVGTRDNIAANRAITTSLAVLGSVVVPMSMVGLANAITTSTIERTREIGVLRCVGARARDVRRIFATEGVAVAVLGWAIGVPVGFALNRMLVWLMREVVNIEVPAAFPLVNLPIVLAGTVAFALLVLALPLRRAVRLRPGDALRYG